MSETRRSLCPGLVGPLLIATAQVPAVTMPSAALACSLEGLSSYLFPSSGACGACAGAKTGAYGPRIPDTYLCDRIGARRCSTKELSI